MMDFAKPDVMVFVFLAVGAIALYSYLSINSYVMVAARNARHITGMKQCAG